MVSREDNDTGESGRLKRNSKQMETYSIPSDKVLPDDQFTDTKCGLKIPFRTKRLEIPQLQRLASPKYAVVLLSMAFALSDGITNGVFSATISTVEKQFQLRSTETGLIGAMVDIGSCIALSIIIYFGESISKTQWIGFGMFCVATGSIIFAVPQYVSPKYTFGEEEWNYCGNVTASNCENTPLRRYRFVLMLATFLFGMGAEYVGSIPLCYLDDNVKQTYSSLYHGIYNSCGAIGPASGYLLGGATLRIFNDVTRKVTITPKSPLWIGAWWICYVIGGLCMFLLIFPALLLPSYLPGSENARRNREQMKSRGKMPKTSQTGMMIRLSSLLKNKLYMAICVSETFHACFLFGFLTYAVKIGVDLYGMTESNASFILGSLSIASAFLGYILGGAVITKFKLTMKGIITFMIVCAIVSFAFSFGFLVRCPGKSLAVIGENTTNSIEGQCNSHCHCSLDKYNPVCDDNGAFYFSPCHAGCVQQTSSSDGFQCGCVRGKNISTDVSASKCASAACKYIPLTVGLIFTSFFGAFLTVTPSTQATLRSVRFEERTMAICVQRVIQIALGRIFGRLVFAKVFESTCLISSTECHKRGTCRLYDARLASTRLSCLIVIEKLVIILALCYAYHLVKQRRRKDNLNKREVITLKSDEN